ncbi:MAG: hypothetical protein LBJ62_08465 [Bifidobacteriaceae bacterium]|nr:hypothetical protein [Bifidobacteriaceae bacterium]
MNTVETPSRLTAHDRCDRCGARAYVRAAFAHGDLLFCAHHARQYRPNLDQIALSIDDFTASLTEPSAN